MSDIVVDPAKAREIQKGHERAQKMIASGDYFHGSATLELDALRSRIRELEEKNRWLEIQNGELSLRLRGVPAPAKTEEPKEEVSTHADRYARRATGA